MDVLGMFGPKDGWEQLVRGLFVGNNGIKIRCKLGVLADYRMSPGLILLTEVLP